MEAARSLLSKGAVRDLLAGSLVLVAISAVLVEVDFFELFFEFTREHEEYELDELLVAVFPLILGISLVS